MAVRMKYSFAFAVALLISGCVRTSVMPLAQDTVEISAHAAPVCGEAGAQGAAFQRAAVETIRRGYDRFVIVNADYQNNVRVVATTPVVAQTNTVGSVHVQGNMATGNASSTTTYSGGFPIVAGHHREAVIVKMFKNGDPQAADALDARSELGSNWQEAVASPDQTCTSR